MSMPRLYLNVCLVSRRILDRDPPEIARAERFTVVVSEQLFTIRAAMPRMLVGRRWHVA